MITQESPKLKEFKKSFGIREGKSYLEILEPRTYSDPAYRIYQRVVKMKHPNFIDLS